MLCVGGDRSLVPGGERNRLNTSVGCSTRRACVRSRYNLMG